VTGHEINSDHAVGITTHPPADAIFRNSVPITFLFKLVIASGLLVHDEYSKVLSLAEACGAINIGDRVLYFLDKKHRSEDRVALELLPPEFMNHILSTYT
jgi:hypothetical protein